MPLQRAASESRQPTPATISGSATFCSTLRSSSSIASCSTRPIERRSSGSPRRRIRESGWPATVISPSVGASSAAIRRSTVVFPAPDGPSSRTNSLRATWKLRSFKHDPVAVTFADSPEFEQRRGRCGSGSHSAQSARGVPLRMVRALMSMPEANSTGSWSRHRCPLWCAKTETSRVRCSPPCSPVPSST